MVQAGRVALSLKERGEGGGKEEGSWNWLMKGVAEAFGSKNAKVREQVCSFFFEAFEMLVGGAWDLGRSGVWRGERR